MMNRLVNHFKPFPNIPQVGMECGTTALAILLKYYGLPNFQMSLVNYVKMGADGISLNKLAELARLFGFEADGYQISYDDFDLINLPCIVHYGSNHFVVVYKISASHVWFSDPAYGRRKLTKSQFLEKWKGVVLNLLPPEQPMENDFVKELAIEGKQTNHAIINQYILPVFRANRRLLFLALGLLFSVKLCLTGTPLLMQYVLDKFAEGIVFSQFIYFVLVCLGVTPIIGYVMYLAKRLLARIGAAFEGTIYNASFKHLLHIEQSYFDAHSKEDLVFRFLDKLALREYFSEAYFSTFIDAFMGIGSIFVISLFSPLLALLSVLYGVVYVLAKLIVERKKAYLKAQVIIDQVSSTSIVYDSLMGMETIKATGITSLIYNKWEQIHKKGLTSIAENTEQEQRFEAYFQVIQYCCLLTLFAITCYLWQSQLVSTGTFIACLFSYLLLQRSYSSLVSCYENVLAVKQAFYQLKDMLVQKSELELGKTQQLSNIGNVTIENLGFFYSDNQEIATIDQFSVEIKSGDKVGIVGRNGSGKSTLVKLLMGFYNHYEGKISFGGVDFRLIQRQIFREKVFFFPQEVYLFGGSIRDNITCGMEVSEELLSEVLEKTALTDFVDSLYYGLNQRVGEWGMHISQGQKLKIAFARLFIRNPDLIILDEASSALDMEAESHILTELYRQFAEKTIIAIAHRMHTLKQVDKLLVLDNGCLVEQGKHDELITQNGVYAQLLAYGL